MVHRKRGYPTLTEATRDSLRIHLFISSDSFVGKPMRGQWHSTGRLPKDPQIYVIRIDDGVVRQITRGKPGFMSPSWSRDGHTLYADALEDGSDRTYLIPVAGGKLRFVFTGSDRSRFLVEII